jgi:hypothetical protein
LSLYELTAQEIYFSYTENQDPQELMTLGRTDLATRLQVEHDLNQEDAFYAADEILKHAQTLMERPDVT